MKQANDPYPSKPSGISGDELRRAWRIVCWAGLLGSLYGQFCILGAPRNKWLIDLGATASDFGLIGGAGALAIGFQILGAHLTNLLRTRKLPWMIITISHRVLYTAIVLAPLLFADPRTRMGWIIAFVFIHDALAHTSTPMWFSWMTDLLPRDSMNLFWAQRQRFITAATTIFLVLMAAGFDVFEKHGLVMLGYTILAGVGIVLGVIDILLFRWVPEPPHQPLRGEPFWDTLVEPMRDAAFRRFLLFMAYWNFSIFVAAPFFAPFMMKNLAMSAFMVQMISVVSSLGVVVGSNYWGLLCDTFGFRRILQVLAVGKIAAPACFLVALPNNSATFILLTVLMFLDGFLNAGAVLAPQGVMLKATPRRNRTMYIAAVNFLSLALGATVASVITGKLIDLIDARWTFSIGSYEGTGYHWAFVASTLMRVGAIPLSRRINDEKWISWDEILPVLTSWKAFAVAQQVARLQSSNSELARYKAAAKLGRLRSPLAVTALVKALNDTNLVVRKAALDALAEIGSPDVVEHLAAALFNPKTQLHARAAQALARVGNPQSLRALLKGLRSSDPRVVRVTINSLARLREPAALVPLISLFHEVEDPTIRETIVRALSRIAEVPSTEEVYEALEFRPAEVH
ncbi:MAG: MFS transporter [Candidatus Sumerlaeaceae bacterium]|nr:MFS transporter [Candidatus Sumerlaeaceae bacterium]